MTPPFRQARGFTLVEVMVALAILVGALYVLVDSQAQALLSTREAGRMLTATMLAREKMDEVLVQVELDGFGDTDFEEEGDFADFGAASDLQDLDLDLDFGDEFAAYRWAWTIREIDLSLGGDGDLGAMADTLAGDGYWGDQASDEERREVLGDKASSQQDQQRDLSDIGVGADMIGEMLGNYIREVRVVVWWGDDEEGADQVELVTHVINPSGVVVGGIGGAATSEGGASAGDAKSSGSGGKSGRSGGSTNMKTGSRTGGSSTTKSGGRSGGAPGSGPGLQGARP